MIHHHHPSSFSATKETCFKLKPQPLDHLIHHHRQKLLPPLLLMELFNKLVPSNISSFLFHSFLSPPPQLTSDHSPMGNVTSVSDVGKVVLSDGSIQEFNEPLTVAELMLEHPRQVVVEIRSTVAGKRPTPLPADEKLDLKKVYMMVPMKGGKPSPLSSEEIRRVLLCVNSAFRSHSLFLSSSKVLPWFARTCTTMTATTTIGATRMEIKKEDPMEIGGEEISWETEMAAEGRPEYLSRQLSGRGWKPSLDTIKEKKMEKKFSRWLFNF